MSTGWRIKQAAEASGFSPATLRYYEQLGLLPEPTRATAGHRTYDASTLRRLSFIARAKQLGCTLEEISSLTVAAEGGRCGPVQGELRHLVAGKITTTQKQISDLMTFASELQIAAAALERHRPDGARDDACGCVSAPEVSDVSEVSDDPSPQPVALTSKPAVAGEPAIACTLPTGSMTARLEDWRQLLTHVERREPLEDGIRCVFGADAPTAELMRLVAAEQHCCRFFRFAITVDGRGVALEVGAPADAQSIVTAMFGGAT